MRISSLGALLVTISIGLTGSAQSQTSDTLQSLKNSLSPDQQSSILQDVLGKGTGTGKKTDPKLESPETVRRKNGDLSQSDFLDKEKFQKTLDGRRLRQFDEDPELRADDTVLIELISLDELCNENLDSNQTGNQPSSNGSDRKNAPSS